MTEMEEEPLAKEAAIARRDRRLHASPYFYYVNNYDWYKGIFWRLF